MSTLPTLQGFTNPGTSCFMNAVLLAMFGPPIVARQGNPVFRDSFEAGERSTLSSFVVALLQNDVAPNTLYCDPEESRDNATRRAVQDQLRYDVSQLLRGERVDCSTLRTTLGRACRERYRAMGQDTPAYQDLSRGQQDARDLYERLLGVFDYHPMQFHTRTAYARGVGDEQVSFVSEEEVLQPALFYSTNVFEMEPNEQLQDSWQGTFFDEVDEASRMFPPGGNPEGYLLAARAFMVDRADHFVVNLVRENPLTNQLDHRPIGVPHEITLDTIDPNAYAQVAPEWGGTQSVLQVARVRQRYRLLAAVVHSGRVEGGAHYTTLLRVPTQTPADMERYGVDQWWYYDDLVRRPQRFRPEVAERILTERAVLLFYFPMDLPRAIVMVDDAR